MLLSTIARVIVWSFSNVATVVHEASVALLVEQIFSATSEVDGPPIVEVVEVLAVSLTEESFVALICVPVAPVATSESESVEVVRITDGIVGLFLIKSNDPLDAWFQSD